MEAWRTPPNGSASMPGMSSPPSDEAGSSAQVDITKSSGAEAASYDDLVGVAQSDVQCQQETWVKYTTHQEAQVLPEWKQQDGLVAQAAAGFGKPHLRHGVHQIDPAHPLSASLKIVQAPAAYNRPIVQKKLFKPPFVVISPFCHPTYCDVYFAVQQHVHCHVHLMNNMCKSCTASPCRS